MCVVLVFYFLFIFKAFFKVWLYVHTYVCQFSFIGIRPLLVHIWQSSEREGHNNIGISRNFARLGQIHVITELFHSLISMEAPG